MRWFIFSIRTRAVIDSKMPLKDQGMDLGTRGAARRLVNLSASRTYSHGIPPCTWLDMDIATLVRPTRPPPGRPLTFHRSMKTFWTDHILRNY